MVILSFGCLLYCLLIVLFIISSIINNKKYKLNFKNNLLLKNRQKSLGSGGDGSAFTNSIWQFAAIFRNTGFS